MHATALSLKMNFMKFSHNYDPQIEDSHSQGFVSECDGMFHFKAAEAWHAIATCNIVCERVFSKATKCNTKTRRLSCMDS